MQLEGKRILVLGLAREGVALTRFLAGHGADVIVTDSAGTDTLSERLHDIADTGAKCQVGGNYPHLVQSVDMLFVSPGVPETNSVYRAAMHSRVPVESMTTLFFDLCPGKIVGITGSSGKTTTTSLVVNILSTAGYDSAVGGNIGDPMIDLLPRIGPGTLAVLELSSFQLALLQKSPHISVLTNISPNHLDRHASMGDYIDAKSNILRFQTSDDFAILNQGDALVAPLAALTTAHVRWFAPTSEATPGAAKVDGWVGIRRDDFMPILPVTEIPLLGMHNVENVLAAIAVCDVLGVSHQAMAHGIRTYRSQPHRLQVVSEWAGTRYIDDSIATSPVRTSVALEALDPPILLIAGGRDKKLPWEDLARLIASKVRALFLIGEAAPLIEEAVRSVLRTPDLLEPDSIFRCPTLHEAVVAAGGLASPGDTVLLSPACASYDMFNDFAERGDAFAREVEALHAA